MESRLPHQTGLETCATIKALHVFARLSFMINYYQVKESLNPYLYVEGETEKRNTVRQVLS